MTINDRSLLYFSTFARALATGMMGVLLGIYLARVGLKVISIGLVISAGLLGAATATLVVTLVGDHWGRRRALLLLTLLSMVGGIMAALFSEQLFLGVAAFLGMLNGMGRDRGASLVLEQAILPLTVTDQERTQVFAWYNLLQDVGHALGGLLAGIPVLLRLVGVEEETSFRLTMLLYASFYLPVFGAYLHLSALTETVRTPERLVLSPQSRVILTKISALFAVDSIAGGFVGTALISFYFYTRFGVNEAVLGILFLGARLANALSHLGAAWLAKRIGLVNTMVFTHIPSSLLLMTVAIAPNFGIAALLFILREGLVEMDVPTRQSYVMAVVRPQERTFASGVTHLVRMGGWAIAPSIAGWLMQSVAPAIPLIIGATMKIGYDILLYSAFKAIKPPEEQ
ncbi:major facilitator transporter [Thioploca ingrica]|uniref:Major facilitator transporter n=1 Tax=Thioploca ingrica TaxID=40754 RepID=A0A090AM11_9GAMM|nr:major facilitator transporter [Thioploca ingrica]